MKNSELPGVATLICLLLIVGLTMGWLISAIISADLVSSLSQSNHQILSMS